jgi:hypothetical protein
MLVFKKPFFFVDDLENRDKSLSKEVMFYAIGTNILFKSLQLKKEV